MCASACVWLGGGRQDKKAEIGNSSCFIKQCLLSLIPLRQMQAETVGCDVENQSHFSAAEQQIGVLSSIKPELSFIKC